MGWGLGFDERWDRWIGYSVPALCDFPDCFAEIDRGLAYVCCDEEPRGGERGCGLYFCGNHNSHGHNRCYRCSRNKPPFEPKPELFIWVQHLMTDESWAEWRKAKGNGYEKIAAAWPKNLAVAMDADPRKV